MSTIACKICGGSYDESLCPYCYERYGNGELPFNNIPERLMEFYDSGLEKLSLTFEIWQDFEKIRRRAVAKMQAASRTKRQDTEEWETFCEEVNEQAKAEVEEVIDKSLPLLRKKRDLYESDNNNNLEDFKIKF